MGGKEKWGGGRGEIGKESTYLDGTRQILLLNLAWLPISGNVRQCAHVSF